MEYKKYQCDSFNVWTIKTSKFKNCQMEIIFRSEALKEKITARTFLSDMLSFSSKDYPTRRSLDINLENLYNSYYYGVVSRTGKMFVNHFCFDFLNPKYMDEDILEELISFPFKMIENANIKENEFDHESFNIIKSRMETEIRSIRENPKKQAILETLEKMAPKTPASFQAGGYLEDLKNITPANLVDTYNDMINNDLCDIYLIGDLDMDKVVDIIKESFHLRSIKTKKIPLEVKIPLKNKVVKVTKPSSWNQATLVIGCKTTNLTKKERHIVMPLYNMILGSGSLETKLAKYLRQENSLCYNVSSIFQKYDNVLLINAGIDNANFEKAVKLAKKALKEMKMGKITKDELNNAKKAVLTSLEAVKDVPTGLLSNYFFHSIDDLPLIDERKKMYQAVTIKDLEVVSQKIKIDTIYLLKGAQNEGN